MGDLIGVMNSAEGAYFGGWWMDGWWGGEKVAIEIEKYRI